MRKFYPWYLAGEDVPPVEVQRLLTIEDLDAALDALRALAGLPPRAASGRVRPEASVAA